MSEKEKQAIKTMADIFSKLPADKQQYFNGYANGVADMAEAQAKEASAKMQQTSASLIFMGTAPLSQQPPKRRQPDDFLNILL